MQVNKCTQTGTMPVVQTETGADGKIRQRVFCPATHQATAWADTIPEAVAAWNAAHPAPEPEIPTIPLLPKEEPQA